MSKARRFAFTWHDYSDETVEYLMKIPPEKCDYLIGGFEICPETSRKHIQGYVEFATPLTMGSAKGRLDPKLKSKSPVHLEIALKIRAANIHYCTKKDTKDESAIEKWGNDMFEVKNKIHNQGKRSDWHEMHDFIKDKPDFCEFAEQYPEAAIKYHAGIDRLIRAVKEKQQFEEFCSAYEDAILTGWQSKIVDELKFPANDRKIIWIWGKNGNAGKSWLSRYLVAKLGAARFENASSKDIAHAYEGQPIVCFDYSRTVEERVNYQILESLKNQTIFSPKYNSSAKYFKTPHVICFANWEPNRSTLTGDRWDVRCIDDFGPYIATASTDTIAPNPLKNEGDLEIIEDNLRDNAVDWTAISDALWGLDRPDDPTDLACVGPPQDAPLSPAGRNTVFLAKKIDLPASCDDDNIASDSEDDESSYAAGLPSAVGASPSTGSG